MSSCGHWPYVCHLSTPLNDFSEITIFHMESSIKKGLKVCSDGHSPLTWHLSATCPRLWMTWNRHASYGAFYQRGKFVQMVTVHWLGIFLPLVHAFEWPEIAMLHMGPFIKGESLFRWSVRWLAIYLSIAVPLNDFFEITMLHVEPSIEGR